jgi:hypothetical protein
VVLAGRESTTSATNAAKVKVAVKGMPRVVIAAGRARVGVASGILDVAQRDPSVQRERHHRVPQAVRGDVLCQPGRRASRARIRAASWRSSRPRLFETSSGPSVRPPSAASIARTVRGANGTACAGRPCQPPRGPDGRALDTKVDDIGRARFGYSQPVQGAQAGEGVVPGRSGLGRGQEPDCLLAVKPKRLGITRHRGRRTWAAGEWGCAPSWTA